VTASDLCLLDGRIVPLAEARISPLDRGFLFGDSIYEAIKVRDGRILFLSRHLDRLRASLAALRIPEPSEPPGIATQLEALRARARLASGALYLQITRGVAPERRHLPPPGLVPTLFALPIPLAFASDPASLPGLTAMTRADDRWRHCDVKTTALAASVLGKLIAADAGADEVLYLSPDGELREGGHTNLLVRDGAGWHTHPLGPEILAGVTRAVLRERAAAAGIAIAERAPLLARRGEWRELLATGTTTGVRGIVRLDGVAIGDGGVGEGTRELARILDQAERAEAQA
jgi:D-alanine transaminase